MREIRFLVCAFLLLAATAGAFAQEAPQTVAITLSNYAFTPSAITLKAGVPATLHLVNGAPRSHDFTAKEFFAASTVAAGDEAKLHGGTIELEPGQSLDVTVTPATPGSYPLKCTHFLHASMGMTGTIMVQ